MAPLWLFCQVNSVADADDEDQRVVGAVYNVSLQLGTPIGVAVSNVVANSSNSTTAVGANLLRGYNATFYCVAVLGGHGLIATVFLAPNSDPASMSQAYQGNKADADAELGSDSVGRPGAIETARNSEDKSATEPSSSVSLDGEKRAQ